MTQPQLAHSTPWGRMYARSITGNTEVPSITTVISGQAVDLGTWYGRMAAKELASNPRLPELLADEKKMNYAIAKASKAAGKYRDEAAARGDRVHYYAESVALQALGLEHRLEEALEALRSHSEEKYAKAFDAWWRSYNVRPTKTEITVWNDEVSYAGTLDLVAEIGGRTCIVDYKTKTSDYRGQVRLPDDKVVMQLVAGLKATESLVDPNIGQWENFNIRLKDPLLLAVAIGENGTRTVQANPKHLDIHWRKFVSLRRLWEACFQVHEQEALLLMDPPHDRSPLSDQQSASGRGTTVTVL